MRRVRPRLLAIAAVSVGWIITWIVSSAHSATCNPDDLTDCDAVGSVLLALFYGLPVVLLVLLVLLVPGLAASLARRLRSRQHPRNG
jgi:hypothetical protein